MKSKVSLTLCAALLGVACLILWDVVFRGGAFFERDLIFVYFAEVAGFVRAISEGALPLRDPTTGFGQPILGNPESQVFYPPTWLHLVLPPGDALSIIILINLMIGGLGAAALARRLTGSARSAFFAGAFWMACGPLQSAFNLWHHFAGGAWIPWVLLNLDRFLERPGVSRALSLGAIFGIQVLAGSADMCAMTLMLSLLRVVCEERLLSRFGWRSMSMLGASLAVGLLLGASMWMPVAELVGSTTRSALSREERVSWSVHPLMATESFIPTLLGTLPMSLEASGRLTDGRTPFLKSLFLGPLILPLALCAFLSQKTVPRKHLAFLGTAAFLTGATALGRFTPVYDFLVWIAPPLGLFRYPSKAAIPFSLFITMLAALGTQATLNKKGRALLTVVVATLLVVHSWVLLNASRAFAHLFDPSRPGLVVDYLTRLPRGLTLAVAALVFLGIACALDRPRAWPLAATFSLVSTILINRPINPTVPREVLNFKPDSVEAVKDDQPSRLYAFDYLHYPARSAEIFGRGSLIVRDKAPGLDPSVAFIAVVRSALMTPTAGLWDVEYAWDYDLRGLFDQTLREGVSRVRASTGQSSFVRLLQLGNVSRVAALHTGGFESLTLERTLPMPLPEPLYVFRVPDPLPRVYAVSGARRLSLKGAMDAILEPSFDPRSETTIDEGSETPISASFRGTASLVNRRSDRLQIDAKLNEAGYVVAVEGFLPGWQATIDGKPVATVRANALFVGAFVPAGQHEVVFSYRPRGALLGMSLTILTAAILIAFAVTRATRRVEP